MLWSGTYKQKKIIKLSPDVFIKVWGNNEITICPKCEGKLNLSDYVTQVSTFLPINGTIGNASFTLSMPRHGHYGSYMVRGGRVFGLNLMDEVEIFKKSRYPDKNGENKYYKTFWGVITNITESYSGGVQEIQVSCESMLKWLQLMVTNEHPCVNIFHDSSIKLTTGNSIVTGKIFADLTVYQIIYLMVNITFLNIVVPEQLGTEVIKTPNDKIIPIPIKHPQEIELNDAWARTFASIRSNLRMFGTSPENFVKKERPNKEAVEKASTDGLLNSGKTTYDPYIINWDSKALMDFKPFAKFDDPKSLDLTQSNYKNNLEIINEVKLFTGFEFFLDTVGEIIFKPPFWNVDVRSNDIYIIRDSDIISWSFNESESDVVTRVEVSGMLTQPIPTNPKISPRGIYTNYNLARQFGIRSRQISMRFFTSSNWCYYHAISEMDRINSERFRGALTIIGRPELRLGLPVYIESRDCFGYIESISHNFVFGGSFTTELQITALRRKYIGNDPLASTFKDNQKRTQNPTIQGKSAILIQEFDARIASEDYYKIISKNLTPEAKQKLKDLILFPTKKDIEISKNFKAGYNFFRTNNAGKYVEYSLEDGKAQALLKQAQNAKTKDNQNDYLKFLDIAIPVSDEEGYELIGSYENGRFIYLDSSGNLKRKSESYYTFLKQTKNFENNTGDISNSKESERDNAVKTYSAVIDPPELPEYIMQGELPKNVSEFLSYKSLSLKDLQPDIKKKDIKKCSCIDPAFYSYVKQLETSTNNKPTNKATPIDEER